MEKFERIIKKIEIINKYETIINSVRRKKIADKTMLVADTKISWPTINKMLTQHDSEKYKPIVVKNAFSLNRYFSFHLGISVGATEIKVVCLDFDLKALTYGDYQKLNLLNLINNLKKDTKNLDEIENSKDSDDVCFCYDTGDSIEKIATKLNYAINTFLLEDNDCFDLVSIGISFPGIINVETLRIDFSPNLKCLQGVCLRDLLYMDTYEKIRSIGTVLSFEHDSHAATIFEKEWVFQSNLDEKIKEQKNLACVYIGAGIGLGVVNNNLLCRGSTNSFGEIGHIRAPRFKVEKNGVLHSSEKVICDCGKTNCLEINYRRDVFDSNTLLDYIKSISDGELADFPNKKPHNYLILKEYIGYIINILINIFNSDVIVFSGRIVSKMPQLKQELHTIKLANSIGIPSSACNIICGSEKIYSAAGGAAISSFFSCCNEKKSFFTINWN